MGGRETRAALGLVIFFASLPLQWQILAVTPVGTLRWFHIGALILVLLAPPTKQALVDVWATVRPLPSAVLVLTVMLLAAAVAYRSDWAEAVQNSVYVFFGLCCGTALLTALGSARARAIAAWAGPAALVSFVAMFGGTLSTAGIQPSAVGSALLGADPAGALIRYFRIAFHSVNESEAVNTRHEIFAALIVAGYVALICRPTGRLRVVINVSLLVTAALVVVSLSRAVILAGALPLLLAAARALLRTRVSIFAMVLTGAAVVAAPVLGPPLWALFNGRFVEDTGSYGARLQAIANISSGKFASRLLLGGGDFGLSTHTMVLDATLRGSLIAGLAALVVIAVFFRHTARAAAAFMNSGELAALAAFGAGALAIVRAFTGGGGLPHLVEWSAIGAMVAAEVARRSRSSAEANSAGFVLGRPQAAIADVPRRF